MRCKHVYVSPMCHEYSLEVDDCILESSSLVMEPDSLQLEQSTEVDGVGATIFDKEVFINSW